MRSLSFLLTLLVPSLITAVSMDMSVAWFNVNEESGTCSDQEGAAIGALMIPAMRKVTRSLSVVGGGKAWDMGDDENRRELIEFSDSLESGEDEDRELCSICPRVCPINWIQCKYVYNCCPCGYCRRLSPEDADGVSPSVVASSLEIACEGVLQGIVSSEILIDLSAACMESLKGSECKAGVSLGG